MSQQIGVGSSPLIATPLAQQAWPLQSQAPSFYGVPSDTGWYAANMVKVICPWKLYYGTTQVDIAIHKKCADSLARVLAATWDAVGQDYDTIQALRYDRYSGSYNYRPMRTVAELSMHSFGCAIDWDAPDNPQHQAKHLFTDASPLIVKFKEEGWIWGGDWSPNSLDAMHVQAARVHP